MAKLFTAVSDGDFESLANYSATSANTERMRNRRAGHTFAECDRPFRCGAHRRQAEAAKRAKQTAATMAAIYNAPITGTHDYAEARGTR